MSAWLTAFACGLGAGIVSAWGVGGGTLLLVLLTLVLHVEQRTAQGINLLYFIPTAIAALLLHSKNHQLEWKAVLPAALCGCATAAGFSLLAMGMELQLLRRLFGIFLLFTSISELKKKPK